MDFELDLHTVSEANVREHWAKKHKRSSTQRKLAQLKTNEALSKYGRSILDPVLVKITRYGKRTLDSDNLARSNKAIRDGIADALGIDDGSDRLRWFYAQNIAKDYKIRVQII